MKKDKEKTKVKFLIHSNSPVKDMDDLFAYFPDEFFKGVLKIPTAERMRMSYSHIGQHSECNPEYAAESRKATPEEYADLKKELEEQVGYNLEIIE
jgi:hypothetical protein